MAGAFYPPCDEAIEAEAEGEALGNPEADACACRGKNDPQDVSSACAERYADPEAGRRIIRDQQADLAHGTTTSSSVPPEPASLTSVIRARLPMSDGLQCPMLLE